MFHETYNELLNTISDDEALRTFGQKGSDVKPSIAPEWLRDAIAFLEDQVNEAISENEGV